MSKFLSGRQSNLKLGVKGYTESKTVLETTGRVGIGTTNAESFSLYVIGPTNITGIATFKSDVFIDEQLYVGGVNVIGGASIGQDVSARNLLISGISTFQGSVHHPDDVVVNFGDSDDLKIYHDSSGQSYIKDVGTGDLNLVSNGTGIHLQNDSGSTLARFYTAGPSEIHHAGSRKIHTTSNGVEVTGLTDTDTLNVSGDSTFVGGVDVDGHTELDNLNVSGIATVAGNTDLNGNLDVDGNTELDGLNVDGSTTLDNTTVDGTLIVNGDIDLSGDIDVDGHTELDQLRVAGVSTFAGNVDISSNGNLTVAGNLIVQGTQTQLNTTALEVEDINIGIASADPKLSNAALDGAGITIYGSAGDKTLTWSNANSRMEFNTDLYSPNFFVGGITATGDIDFDGDLDVDGHTELDQLRVSGITTFQNNVHLPDNVKINLGTGDDLEIYHNANNSHVDNKTGDLYIKNFAPDADVIIQTDDGSGGETDYILCDGSTGSVKLNHYGSLKLETTGIGVSIYNDLNVGTGVTIYGNAGIVSAISFYGDGSNLTNTGATLSATSGVERLVTTQLTSGTMVDAATDADLTFDAGTNTLNTQNIQISGGISTNGTAYGQDGQLLRSTGTGWEWRTVPGIFSVNNILNGFNVLEEGSTVGTAGSIHTLDFRGINVTATANPQPNGIATITFSSTPTFTDLTVLNNTTIPNVIGITTFSNNVNVGSAITMYASTGIISATKFYGDGSNLLNTGATLNPASGTQRLVLTSLTSGTMVDAATDSDLTYDAISDKLNVANLDISGITTLGGPVTAGSSEGVVGQYLRHVGTGVTWANFPTLRTTQTNTATAGQTTFNFSYNVDFLDVFVNGVKLSPTEYTATNGNQIVLNTPAFADEVVEFHSYNITSTYGGGGGGGGGASNLDGLIDVTIGTLADGQLLQYNSSSGEWENISAATVVGAASSFATKSSTASTATAGQTTFSGTYTVGFVDVFLNGVKQSEDQYTATTGTNVVLNDGASEGDLIEVVGLTANVPGSGGGGSSYTNSDVDAHLNRSTATTGQVLSWNGSDYDWVAQSGGGGGSGISLTDLSVTQNSAGTAALTYNNTNGVFSYTPPDLSSYLTSYTETDTLATVTGRGSSTNSNLTFGGNLSVSGISTFTTDKVFFENGGTPLPATLQIETGVAGVGNTIRSSNTLDLVTNGSAFKLELDTTNAIIAGGTGAAQYVQLYGTGSEKLKTIGTGVTVTGTTFSNQLSVSGISTLSNVTVGGASTEMVVDGDLRVTGIITTGTGSVTIDGNTNEIIVGTGVTIYGNTGIVSATEVASNSLQFTKNNVTIAGTAGTAGQFKQIGGAPFYYDGTAWREIVLSDGTPVTTSADTDWDNVLLRLDFEQASTDVSLIENRKVLFDGNDQNPDSPRANVVDLTSSPVKFGSKALRFNGQTTVMPFAWQNRQSANNDPLFDFEGPFTLELWIYIASSDLPGSSAPMPIVSQTEISSGPTNDWALSLTYPGTGSVYNFNWYNQNHGTGAVSSGFGKIVGGIGAITLSDQWNHIALVREAGDSSIHFYLNGTESQYTNGITSTLVDTTVNWGSVSDYLSFGYHYNMSGQARVFKGVMDDIRLSKSARYTSNFTAPTAAHPISGTSTTVYTPPGSKQGEIALGSTPVWTGTTGVTVSQVASGQYRMTFASAFASDTAYSVNVNAMDYDPATSIVGVGVSRVSSSACDFYVRRLSDSALVDTGSLAVNVYKK